MRVLILSEDGSSRSEQVVRSLLLSSWRLIRGYFDESAVEFLPADPARAKAAKANLWRSKQNHDQQAVITLRQYIATNLLISDCSFVYFHYDGDVAWSGRDDGVAKPAPEVFDERMRTQVFMLLQSHGGAQAECALRRLVEVVPYYSVEAWAYQNTQVAREICLAKYGCVDGGRLSQLEADRGWIDEVEKPKDEFALGGAHNLELVESTKFPASRARDAGKSFASFVRSQRDNTRLMECLATLG